LIVVTLSRNEEKERFELLVDLKLINTSTPDSAPFKLEVMVAIEHLRDRDGHAFQILDVSFASF
jgi:hypothetical protein